MIRNYIVIAFRNLQRHKVFSFINIMGLAVGMAACYLMFLYVNFEKSYDNFHTKGDRIYRIVTDVKTESENIPTGITTGPTAVNTKKEFPGIEEAVRITPQDGFLITKGNVRFQE